MLWKVQITVIRFLILVYKNYLFPGLEYFLVQFIEDNVKFIVDETELRKEDNTTLVKWLLEFLGINVCIFTVNSDWEF